MFEQNDELSKIVELLIRQESASSNGETSDSDFSRVELNELLKARGGLDLVQRAIELENAQKRLADQSTSVSKVTLKSPFSSEFSGQQVALPDRIGRFEIVRELGRGGFGVVLLARDPKLGRNVALKMLNAYSLASNEATARFEREAQSAAMLGHPNIIPIFESGSVGPCKYIAFEYCSGTTLANWMKEAESVSNDAAAKIVETMAFAVQHAHARGVVHRDLKPGNVLLASSDDSDAKISDWSNSIRITDFGLAKINDNETDITKTGATLGTPAYMSPEQARGEMEKTGPASDVYSLGAIFYELLTGQIPFRKENNVQTLRAIETETPISPAKINRDIHKDLEAVCLKCLEKNPADRYATAHDLGVDLERWRNGQPVAARPSSVFQRCVRWCQLNPGFATAVAMVVALLITATLVSTMFAVSASRNSRIANSKTAETTLHAKRLRRAINELLVAIAAEPRIQAAGMESFRATLLTSANDLYQEMRSELPKDENVLLEYVRIVDQIAEVYASLGTLVDAEPMILETQSLLESELPSEPGLLARMFRYRAMIANDRDHDLNERADWLTKSVELRKSVLADSNEDEQNISNLVEDLGALTDVQLQIMALSDAKTTNDFALEVLADWNVSEKWRGINRLNSGQTTHLAAVIATKENRFGDAKNWFRQTIESLGENEQFPIPVRKEALKTVASSYLAFSHLNGINDERELKFQNAVLARKAYSQLVEMYPESPRHLVGSFNSQIVEARAGHQIGKQTTKQCIETCQVAIVEIDEAAERFPILRSDFLGQKSNFLNYLTILFRRDRDLEAAIKANEQAVEINRILWEQTDYEDCVCQTALSTSLQQLATLRWSKKKYQESLDTIDEAIELASSTYEAEQSIQLRDILLKYQIQRVQRLYELERYNDCVTACQRLLDLAQDMPEKGLQRMLKYSMIAVNRIYLESLWITKNYAEGKTQLAELTTGNEPVTISDGGNSAFGLTVSLLKSAQAISEYEDHDPEDFELLRDSAHAVLSSQKSLPKWQREQIEKMDLFDILGEERLANLFESLPESTFKHSPHNHK